MKYTGKLVGYSVRCESTPDGAIVPMESVDCEMLDKAVKLQPTVIIEIMENPISRFLSGVASALENWTSSIFGAIFFVALLLLEGASGTDCMSRYVTVFAIAVQIILAIVYIIGECEILCPGDGIRWWNIRGYVTGCAMGFILMKVLLHFVEPLTINGVLTVLGWFIGFRVAVFLARDFESG